MDNENKTLEGESWKDLTPTEGQYSAINLNSRLAKYATHKTRTDEMAGYLDEYRKQKKTGDKRKAVKAFKKLRDCGNYLRFRHYTSIDEVRLSQACFCGQFKLCPFCAVRRASKMINNYVERYEYLRKQHPEWKWYLVTLTVKDGPNLHERLTHLSDSHKVLQSRRRDWLKKGWGKSLWNHVEAAVGAYEITKGKNSGLWHPHGHFVVAVSKEFPIVNSRCTQLEQEWHKITGDSCVVDVRPFAQDEQTPAKSFCEVFKYALKFSSMSLEDNWKAASVLHRVRLTTSYGALRGVKVPQELTDDIPLDDLPYIELLYVYMPNSHIYGLKCREKTVLLDESSLEFAGAFDEF